MVIVYIATASSIANIKQTNKIDEEILKWFSKMLIVIDNAS